VAVARRERLHVDATGDVADEPQGARVILGEDVVAEAAQDEDRRRAPHRPPLERDEHRLEGVGREPRSAARQAPPQEAQLADRRRVEDERERDAREGGREPGRRRDLVPDQEVELAVQASRASSGSDDVAERLRQPSAREDPVDRRVRVRLAADLRRLRCEHGDLVPRSRESARGRARDAGRSAEELGPPLVGRDEQAHASIVGRAHAGAHAPMG
jgi:hypothetical protein